MAKLKKSIKKLYNALQNASGDSADQHFADILAKRLLKTNSHYAMLFIHPQLTKATSPDVTRFDIDVVTDDKKSARLGFEKRGNQLILPDLNNGVISYDMSDKRQVKFFFCKLNRRIEAALKIPCADYGFKLK